MHSSGYDSESQQIDIADRETMCQYKPSGSLASWLRCVLGIPQRGFLLMTLEGKLSREQRLLKER